MGSDKVIYINMSADLLHPGHLNVIEQACKIGARIIIVGLLTDKAIASYKRLLYMNWSQRKVVVGNVKGVDEAVPQETLDYVPHLLKIQPDHVLHGDDWKTGVRAETLKRIVDAMVQWCGQVIDIPYTKGIFSTALNAVPKVIGLTLEVRGKRLRCRPSLPGAKPIVLAPGDSQGTNNMSSLLIETAKGDPEVHAFFIAGKADDRRVKTCRRRRPCVLGLARKRLPILPRLSSENDQEVE